MSNNCSDKYFTMKPSNTIQALPPADFYKTETYHAEISVGYLMRRIISGISQEIDLQLEPTSLTNAQWMPLFALAKGKADTGAALARVCELDAGSTTRLLDRLEDKALIQRQRSEEDRRVVHLRLTPEGQAAAAQVPTALCQVQNNALSGFTAEEWAQLKTLLQRMLNNIETMKAQRQHHDQ
jgi:DNA-binding MarR family transcriptional regulator